VEELNLTAFLISIKSRIVITQKTNLQPWWSSS